MIGQPYRPAVPVALLESEWAILNRAGIVPQKPGRILASGGEK